MESHSHRYCQLVLGNPFPQEQRLPSWASAQNLVFLGENIGLNTIYRDNLMTTLYHTILSIRKHVHVLT